MSNKIKKGIYQHYKGSEYQVEGTVRHSETEEIMVLYRPLYGEQALWVRPFDMFVEDVKIDGAKKTRFNYIREA